MSIKGRQWKEEFFSKYLTYQMMCDFDLEEKLQHAHMRNVQPLYKPILVWLKKPILEVHEVGS